MRSRYLPRLVPLILVVSLVAACSDSADDVVEGTFPAATAGVPSTSTAPSTTAAMTTTLATTTTTAPATSTTRGPSVPLPNGDFETGDFTGWSTTSCGNHGDWFVYVDGTTPPDPSMTDPDFAFNVPDRPDGLYAAVTDMDYSGVHIL